MIEKRVLKAYVSELLHSLCRNRHLQAPVLRYPILFWCTLARSTPLTHEKC